MKEMCNSITYESLYSLYCRGRIKLRIRIKRIRVNEEKENAFGTKKIMLS